MAGTSAAGMLAGCGGQQAENETTTVPQTQTELSVTTPAGTSCNLDTVKPDMSGGEFTLLHGREESGTQLLQGTKTLFNQGDGPTMTLNRAPSDGFLSKLRSSIPAGKGPQVFLWAHDLAGEFWSNNFLSDQKGNLRVDSCVYTDSSWQAANYTDSEGTSHTIGLPWAAESPALIYNKTILDEQGAEVPTTFDEWKSVMDDYQNKANGKYGLAAPINAYFSSWAAQAFGEEIYNGDEDELGIESDAVKKGVNLILKDLKPYMPSDPGYDPQASVFNDGNAPFMINGPWTTSSLNDKDFDWGVAPIPSPSGGQPRPYMGVKLIYFAKKMNNDNDATKAARQFSEWYSTNNERLLNLANQAGFVPVKTGLAGNQQLPDIVKGFAEQVQSGYPMPQNPKMNAVWTPYENAVLEAFNSGKDVGPLLKDAATKIRNSDTWQSN